MLTHTTIKLSFATLFMIGAIVAAAPAFATAGGKNIIGPDVFDSTSVRTNPPAEVESCFVEPSGFKNNIRWDGACRDALRIQRNRATQATATERPYEEPKGFKSNIRSIAK